MDKEQLFEKLSEYSEAGCRDYLITGMYEGNDFLIFESWEQLEGFNAWLNGFEGLVGSRPYTNKDETLHVKLLEVQEKLKSDPENWSLKRSKENILSYFLYDQFLAAQRTEIISFEDSGIDWGFRDEYDSCCCGCNGCQNIVRTSPDSYSWTPPLFIDCEGYACEECVAAGEFDSYILEEYKNCNKAIPESVIAQLGLTKVNEKSFGNFQWHGETDDPTQIIELLNQNEIDVWFTVYPQQWGCHFDVYVQEDNLVKALNIFASTENIAQA